MISKLSVFFNLINGYKTKYETAYFLKKNGANLLKDFNYWMSANRIDFYPLDTIKESDVTNLVEKDIYNGKLLLDNLNLPAFKDKQFIKKNVSSNREIAYYVNESLSSDLDVLYGMISSKICPVKIYLFMADELLDNKGFLKDLFSNNNMEYLFNNYLKKYYKKIQNLEADLKKICENYIEEDNGLLRIDKIIDVLLLIEKIKSSDKKINLMEYDLRKQILEEINSGVTASKNKHYIESYSLKMLVSFVANNFLSFNDDLKIVEELKNLEKKEKNSEFKYFDSRKEGGITINYRSSLIIKELMKYQPFLFNYNASLSENDYIFILKTLKERLLKGFYFQKAKVKKYKDGDILFLEENENITYAEINNSFTLFQTNVELIRKVIEKNPSHVQHGLSIIDKNVFKKISEILFFEIVLTNRVDNSDYMNNYWKKLMSSDEIIQIGLESYKKGKEKFAEINDKIGYVNEFSFAVRSGLFIPNKCSSDISFYNNLDSLIDDYPETLEELDQIYIEGLLKNNLLPKYKNKLVKNGVIKITDNMDSFLDNIKGLSKDEIINNYKNLDRNIFKALDKRNFLKEIRDVNIKREIVEFLAKKEAYSLLKYQSYILKNNIYTKEGWIKLLLKNDPYVLEMVDFTPDLLKSVLFDNRIEVKDIIKNNPKLINDEEILIYRLFTEKNIEIKEVNTKKISKELIQKVFDYPSLQKNVDFIECGLIEYAYKFPEKFDEDIQEFLFNKLVQKNNRYLPDCSFISSIQTDKEILNVLENIYKNNMYVENKSIEKYINDDFFKNNDNFIDYLDLSERFGVSPIEEDKNVKYQYIKLFNNDLFKKTWDETYGENISVPEVLENEDNVILNIFSKMKATLMKNDLVENRLKKSNKVVKF